MRRLLLLLSALLYFAMPANASYAFIQYQTSGFVGALQTASTPSFTLGAAHLLVVKCIVVIAPVGGACTTLTDTRGNTFTQVIGSLSSSGTLNNGEAAQYWYNSNTTGGTDTVTGTCAGGNGNLAIDVVEYSGIQVGSTFDATTGAISGTGSPRSISVTTTYADDLVIVGFEGTTTGWTWGAPVVERSGSTALPWGDREATPAGSYTATATGGTGDWIATIITFKIASANNATQIGAFIVGP